ncbi:MAG: hypothetical protein RR146_06695 [Lachnospiraceae bacterium]
MQKLRWKQKKLRARILSLVLSAVMVLTTFPTTVFATEVKDDPAPERTITAFDELGEGFLKSTFSGGGGV